MSKILLHFPYHSIYYYNVFAKKKSLFFGLLTLDELKTHFGKWLVILLAALAVIVLVMNWDRLSGLRYQRIDRTDYEAVAFDYIESSSYIANRLGKVTRIQHVGKGGSTGEESYNVFRLVGEEGDGILDLELRRNEAGEWDITLAELNDGGIIYQVPIIRGTGDKWRLFRWNRE